MHEGPKVYQARIVADPETKIATAADSITRNEGRGRHGGRHVRADDWVFTSPNQACEVQDCVLAVCGLAANTVYFKFCTVLLLSALIKATK